MMELDIRYRTQLAYDRPVRESQNELRACPTNDARQEVLSYRVATTPTARLFSFTDYWGTRVDAFGVRDAHGRLEVVAEATVRTQRQPLLAASPRLGQLRDGAFRELHLEYLERTTHADWGPPIDAEAARCVQLVGDDVVGVVLAMHRSIATRMEYKPGATYIGVEVDDVFGRQQGVCQDFAHLLIALCRSAGVPARYVSGYFFEPEAPEVETHAWVEVAIPGAGWWGLDPTNRIEITEQHVKIGHGRDYDDVPPLRGVFSGAASQGLDVSVQMQRTEGSRRLVQAQAEQ